MRRTLLLLAAVALLLSGCQLGFGNNQATKTDSDADGMSDAQENSLGTNPNFADTDHDGLSDRLEVQQGSNPTSAEAPAAPPERRAD